MARGNSFGIGLGDHDKPKKDKKDKYAGDPNNPTDNYISAGEAWDFVKEHPGDVASAFFDTQDKDTWLPDWIDENVDPLMGIGKATGVAGNIVKGIGESVLNLGQYGLNKVTGGFVPAVDRYENPSSFMDNPLIDVAALLPWGKVGSTVGNVVKRSTRAAADDAVEATTKRAIENATDDAARRAAKDTGVAPSDRALTPKVENPWWSATKQKAAKPIAIGTLAATMFGGPANAAKPVLKTTIEQVTHSPRVLLDDAGKVIENTADDVIKPSIKEVKPSLSDNKIVKENAIKKAKAADDSLETVVKQEAVNYTADDTIKRQEEAAIERENAATATATGRPAEDRVKPTERIKPKGRPRNTPDIPKFDLKIESEGLDVPYTY